MKLFPLNLTSRPSNALFIVLFLGSFLLLPGCAFVSVPLTGQTLPFEESVVSGYGKDKILLIDVSGTISSQPEEGLLPFEEQISIVSRVKEELRTAVADKHIRGVILRINTPGGSVTASDILYEEIRRFKTIKKVPVVACMMDMATSGGYYVSMSADKVIAHPTTVTGSIGVIALKFNVQGLMEKIGIEEESIKSGELKDLWSPFRPSTEEEQQILQGVIDTMQERFVDVIAASRKKLNRDQIVKIADGRVYTSKQALDLKLIDGIGYLDDTIVGVKKMAGISEAKVIMYHRPYGYKGTIYSQLSQSDIRTVNLINVDLGSLTDHAGVRFMYLWCP